MYALQFADKMEDEQKGLSLLSNFLQAVRYFFVELFMTDRSPSYIDWYRSTYINSPIWCDEKKSQWNTSKEQKKQSGWVGVQIKLIEEGKNEPVKSSNNIGNCCIPSYFFLAKELYKQVYRYVCLAIRLWLTLDYLKWDQTFCADFSSVSISFCTRAIRS